MISKLSLRIFIPILGLLSLLMLFWTAHAQTPTPPSPRDALIQAIQERAQRDVELGKQSEGAADLNLLFGEQAVAVGMSISEVLEIYEEAYTAATPPKPWWDPFLPLVTGVGIVSLIVLVIQNFLKDYLAAFFKWLGEGAYNRLAGYKPFWWIALRRYRRALVEKYRELKIPFRQGRPLDMREVYVPLKVSGTNDLELIDAYESVAKHKRLVVLERIPI